MYQKNSMLFQSNKISSTSDIDVLGNLDFSMVTTPDVELFTPSTMTRMEDTILSLDGAFDDSDLDSSYSEDSQDTMSSTPAAKVSRKRSAAASDGSSRPRQLPGPKSSRRLEDMTPEEIARRQRRRERNKAAAARCRQRRLDVTNQLLTETQHLESEGQKLEREIENLRRQRDQLQFVLEAHKPVCHGGNDLADMIKSEPVPTTSGAVAVGPVRPSSLPIATSTASSSNLDLTFDLGSTGVTPIVSASGMNLFLPAGTDYMSPSTFLGSPSAF